uniref:Protein kinase domain-containing protein n=1 Tax=Panagrolaimus sp. ES5 TaxID=591445 RepID=A0AC34FXR8_9BILA
MKKKLKTQGKSSTMKLSRSEKEIEEAGFLVDEIKFQAMMTEYRKIGGVVVNEKKPKIGQMLGRCEVLAEIGSGNSIIFLGKIGWRLYAIKWSNNPDVNLRAEYEVSESCWKSDRILKCLQYTEESDFKYLLLELAGKDLNLISRRKNISIKTKFYFMFEVLKGIKQIHDAGFAHQDIKLQNSTFNLKDQKKVNLIDFGIVSKLDRNGICIDGQVGSYPFSARAALEEKLRGKEVDLESWVYSLLFAIKETLPWQPFVMKFQQHIECKKAFWGKKKDWKFLKNMPKQIVEIMDIIDGIKPGGPIDYNAINKLLKEVITGKYELIDGKFAHAPGPETLDMDYRYFQTRGERIGIKGRGDTFHMADNYVIYDGVAKWPFKCSKCHERALHVYTDVFENAAAGHIVPLVEDKNTNHLCKI